MNQLLLLEDKVNISTERCGLVIVRRDFPKFRKAILDLGFKHRLDFYEIGDYHDENFYSVPILDFLKLGYENPEEVQKQILEQCAAHASIRLKKGVIGIQRFLIRYVGSPKLTLTEVSLPEYQEQKKGRLVNSKVYWHGNSEKFAERIPEFAANLQRTEEKFKSIERLKESYLKGM
ncbi:hypothetical protein J4429_01750 [Candidatus Pacearchaeota archaeon]|nr:hypothetical protein [Candidatus Pacearchaeota archaeon]